jgi:hypothetical protein
MCTWPISTPLGGGGGAGDSDNDSPKELYQVITYLYRNFSMAYLEWNFEVIPYTCLWIGMASVVSWDVPTITYHNLVAVPNLYRQVCTTALPSSCTTDSV